MAVVVAEVVAVVVAEADFEVLADDVSVVVGLFVAVAVAVDVGVIDTVVVSVLVGVVVRQFRHMPRQSSLTLTGGRLGNPGNCTVPPQFSRPIPKVMFPHTE